MAGKSFSNYNVIGELGRGGMGVVYKAQDIRQDRVVALKVLSKGTMPGDEIRRRFEREASAGMKMIHPNIVRIFEIGEEHNDFFIAMELIDGQTLRQLIQESPIEPGRMIDIG